jgi:hypothetical protein
MVIAFIIGRLKREIVGKRVSSQTALTQRNPSVKAKKN